jgi:hypothetical protein
MDIPKSQRKLDRGTPKAAIKIEGLRGRSSKGKRPFFARTVSFFGQLTPLESLKRHRVDKKRSFSNSLSPCDKSDKPFFMQRWFCILSVFLGICPIQMQAQVADTFPRAPEAFFQSLGSFLLETRNDEAAKSFQDFEQSQRSKPFLPEELTAIQGICGQMRKKGLSAHPYFSTYLDAVTALRTLPTQQGFFASWHEIATWMLSAENPGPATSVFDFFSFSKYFFLSGHLVYGDANRVRWRLKSPAWSLKIQQGEPAVLVSKANLLGENSRDSILIANTSGVYFPLRNQWRGKGGTVNWERAGLGTEVNASLGTYSIDTRKSAYSADSASLSYPKVLGNQRILGKLSDQLSSLETETGLYNPQFESYQSREIKGIAEGMRFSGGFKLQGKTIFGIGAEGRKPLLQIFNQRGGLAFKATADELVVRQGESVFAEHASIAFYLEKDSIFHPSAHFKFNLADKELLLTRGKYANDRSPFFSSAHQLFIHTDQILTSIDGEKAIIGETALAIVRKPPVAFESVDFYSQKSYDEQQGIASVNPLALIKRFSDQQNQTTLDADQLAKLFNPEFTAASIERLLFDLSAQGFVLYDTESKRIEIQPKLFHYEDAKQQRADFDMLRLISKSDQPNATLHLRSASMEVSNTEFISFSPRQRVSIAPDSNRIILGKNRDMAFSGTLQAGFSELKSTRWKFRYQNFQIEGDSIEYLRLFAPEKRPDDVSEQPEPFALTSDIEDFKGILLIDAERNKSGQADIPMFPSLNTKGKAFVYYDGPFAKDTVYKRDSFYFELDPFHLNQLDNYSKDELSFKGWLVPAHIFPPFRETLRVQSDYSLGFQHNTPAEGYATYANKGNFTGALQLSNNGLRGEGILSFQGAKISARDYLFRPDQLTGSARAFDIPEVRGEKESPKIAGSDVNINWVPYADSMYVTSASQGFKVFDEGIHNLAGQLILTSNGINASGTLDWPDAQIKAPILTFGARSVRADTLFLGIKAKGQEQFALQAEKTGGRIDFDQKKGSFKAPSQPSSTVFPLNQYETSLNAFDWDIEAQTITFLQSPDSAALFTSSHPEQDRLSFRGKTAVYELDSTLLKVGGVSYIVSSDAFIYPDSNRIYVQPGAVITRLEDAVIVCDTLSRKHTISRASVDILGKKEYRASGYYQYPVGNREQEIAFDNIQGTRVGKGPVNQRPSATVAQGEVAEADSFLMDDKLSFYGQISLGSDSENLKFSGFARINSERLPEQQWFSISTQADRKNVVIPFKTLRNPESVVLENGLFLSKEQASVYPLLMMPPYFRRDRPLFPAKGVLRYDKQKDRFIVGDSSIVLAEQRRGNVLTYFSKTGRVEAEGKFNLGSGLKNYKIQAAGTATTQFREGPLPSEADSNAIAAPPLPTDFDLIAGLDFTLPDRLLRIMQNEIASSSFAASPIPYLSDINYYQRYFSEIFPPNNDVESAINGLSNGIFSVPEKDNPYTLLLSGLKMRWDMDYQSLVSKKAEAGLVSIKGKPISQVLDCYVEFKMPSNEDDRVYVYLQLRNQIYYYFGYRNGILEINSNDNRFMDEAAKMKSNELVLKMPDGKSYEIQIVESNRAQMFLRRAKAAAEAK